MNEILILSSVVLHRLAVIVQLNTTIHFKPRFSCRSTQAVIVVDVEKYDGPPYSTATYGSNTNTNNENSLQFINPSQPSVLYNTVSTEYNVSINESAPVNSVVLSLKVKKIHFAVKLIQSLILS